MARASMAEVEMMASSLWRAALVFERDKRREKKEQRESDGERRRRISEC